MIVKFVSDSTNLILKKMGYIDSENLFYLSKINDCKFLSFHNRKVLKELNPVAFYCIDNRPFVLFFESIEDSEEMKQICNKIWNSQTPVVIFNNDIEIKIYNGNAIGKKQELQLIENIQVDDCNENSNFSYWNVTKSGFWVDFAKEYSTQNLNELMLGNIEYITNKLKRDYKVSYATKLVLRLIFIRFLIDRGVDIGINGLTSDIDKSRENLLKIVENPKALYDLFNYLKHKFNGNLFDLDDENDSLNLPNKVFVNLKDFLSGELEQKTGQLALFPLYDFNIIPVELISNIYEIMLGKETQESDKAFYTPHYLVDYILTETVDRFLKNNETCRVLDPACGSGIFLVEAFRRIVNNSGDLSNYFLDDSKLIKLVTENIFGVDKNPDAIDVAIFSLYLTILDYKDPKALNGFKLPNLKNENLIVSDFFDDKKTKSLKDKEFDFVLGNPPWGNIKGGLHSEYQKVKKYPQQNNEISRSFIIKVGEFCNSSTLCCLVLPSKLLYNGQKPAVDFRKLILNNFEIQTVIELSSVRKLVFKNADAPAAIIAFRHNPNSMKNKIRHISLKPNVFFKLFNVIVREKNNIKFVPQRLLLEYDWAWKTLVFGTVWDFDIIKQLKKEHITIDGIIKNNNNSLISGVGIKDNLGEGKSAKHLIGKYVLNSDTSVNHFFINTSNVEVFNKEKIDRPKQDSMLLFKPPYCLTMTGVDCNNYKMKSAFSEDEFLYKTAIWGIKGANDDRNILLVLTGLLNSSFYAYLNLMLGSSIGIEREQRLIKEVKNFPYIYKEKIAVLVERIQKIKGNTEFGANNDAENEIKELDNIVLDVFKLSGNPFVDYALNVQILELTNLNNNIGINTATESDLKTYAKVFTDYWVEKLNKANRNIKIKIYPSIKNKFTVFEMLILDKPDSNLIEFVRNIDESKELFTRFMINKVNDMFFDIKNVINFEENSFFIIKTNEAKNWHPAMAHMDLTEVIDSILTEREVEI